MARDVSDSTPIGSRQELIAWMEGGCRPKADWRLGTEHEKIPFYTDGAAPVPYDGPRGIRALLEGMRHLLGWQPIVEGDHPIGLYDVTGGGAISLEPGGQFELSGAPVETLHQTACETNAHLAQIKQIAEPLGIRFLALGMSPLWSRAETPFMPKQRYDIMRRYMPTVGTLGLDMMFRTATVQVNLDFASEADMVKKLRVSLALQPIATALFANSPFTEGKPNGFLSMRSEIWRDTDRARTGMLPFAFEEGMGFERYVDYAVDVPMYFVKRGDTYVDVAGASFRDLLDGRLAALPGQTASLADWANHLSTIFPEVRLKRFLEMRGADVGPTAMIVALSAFWTGLLYDEAALDAAWDLARTWSAAERQQLRDDVPRRGLHATVGGRSVLAVARDAVALARGGLAARARLDPFGRDETVYLEPLEAIIAEGRSAAERWLAAYHGTWGGSVQPAFQECVF
ncbi:glutamate--cysteine ligase [Chelatococcus reniformis]|uniref:Glutamate--cysteine ligase n=1 Tax=Chelatococcus reniformis TaxID=1494448 RepID=A0A916UD42_9HYPH|nr:glutamate--cysteine ligase [Chelatococcus reniformis]GGC67456.1 glutamate--cysteine ligase [Chelatococcus reniformis]